jgi:hypothetical protein
VDTGAVDAGVVEVVVVELEAAGLELPQPAAATTTRIVTIAITDRHLAVVSDTVIPPYYSHSPVDYNARKRYRVGQPDRQAGFIAGSVVATTKVRIAQLPVKVKAPFREFTVVTCWCELRSGEYIPCEPTEFWLPVRRIQLWRCGSDQGLSY